MDDIIIFSKIESLNRCLNRIKEKTPVKKEIFLNDLDSQDIIILNLERAVQTCVDIASHIIAELDISTPMKMAECFDRLYKSRVISLKTSELMRKSVAFRNIAVHEYQSINWEIVYSVIANHLVDFKEYAKEIITWLENQESELT